MRNTKTLIRGLVTLSCVAVLSGCSLFASKPVNPPAELVQFTPSVNIQKAWSASLGDSGSYTFSPIAVGYDVYAASSNGTIIDVDVTTGKTSWKIKAPTDLTAGVGADSSTIAVVGAKGVIYAYNTDGSLRWKAQAPSEVLSAPAVGDGAIVVRSIDNQISAYDAQTGELRWVTQRTEPSLVLHTAPGIVITQNLVFVSLPGGKLAVLTLNNGGPLWDGVIAEPRGTTELERVADVSGFPVLENSSVCAVAYQGRLSCFDTRSGSLAWSKVFSSDVGITSDGQYVFAANDVGHVSTFDLQNGGTVWTNNQLSYRRLSSPVAVGNYVAVGDLEGYVHFLSKDNGKFVGRIEADDSAVLSTPIVVGDEVIVQTKSGALVALTAK